MKKTILITLALLLACATNAQVVRSGSTQRVIKVHKSKKNPEFDNNAIGINLGLAYDNSIPMAKAGIDVGFKQGYCGSINYQHKINKHSRFELQLSGSYFDNNEANVYDYDAWSISFSSTYQLVFNLTGGWNFYAGAGATIGYGYIYYFTYQTMWQYAQGLDLGIQGVAGTELCLGNPITVFFEVRPWLHSQA